MTLPTGTDGTDGRIDIDVIQSAVGGENADVPGGTHGGSGRGNAADVITSLLGGGRVGIDVTD